MNHFRYPRRNTDIISNAVHHFELVKILAVIFLEVTITTKLNGTSETPIPAKLHATDKTSLGPRFPAHSYHKMWGNTMEWLCAV